MPHKGCFGITEKKGSSSRFSAGNQRAHLPDLAREGGPYPSKSARRPRSSGLCGGVHNTRPTREGSCQCLARAWKKYGIPSFFRRAGFVYLAQDISTDLLAACCILLNFPDARPSHSKQPPRVPSKAPLRHYYMHIYGVWGGVSVKPSFRVHG